MEVLILDTLLRPIDVVDEFVSIIWTERFGKEVGDFQLVALSSPANRKRFVANTWLMINKSKRIMVVENVEEKDDEDRGAVLTIKGRELSLILDARMAVESIDDVLSPVWYITGRTPGDTMRHIFNTICVAGAVSENDIIPYIHGGPGLYPADTIPEPTELINWEQKPATVLSALGDLMDVYDLGIRLYKDPSASNLYFDVYSGSDRTSGQTELPAVIFSPDMENLQDTTEYTDISKAYNVVQVMYIHKNDPPEGEEAVDVVDSVVVMNDDIGPAIEGFDRKVKLLTITSVPDEVTDITAFLIQAGKDELAKSRPIGAFDGEISQYSTFVYERDYYLGDLVETRGNSGAASYMQVSEQIFVEDDNGERSYPTLTTKTYINPGTWASWKYDIEWNAMGADEFWANQ